MDRISQSLGQGSGHGYNSATKQRQVYHIIPGAGAAPMQGAGSQPIQGTLAKVLASANASLPAPKMMMVEQAVEKRAEPELMLTQTATDQTPPMAVSTPTMSVQTAIAQVLASMVQLAPTASESHAITQVPPVHHAVQTNEPSMEVMPGGRVDGEDGLEDYGDEEDMGMEEEYMAEYEEYVAELEKCKVAGDTEDTQKGNTESVESDGECLVATVEDLVAIPEVSSSHAAARRGKHRADSKDDDSVE